MVHGNLKIATFQVDSDIYFQMASAITAKIFGIKVYGNLKPYDGASALLLHLKN
jgi:hypothetical protein